MVKNVYEKCGCAWVLENGKSCGKPVKWKMVRDDDGKLRRQYEPFCPEHMRKSQEDDTWD